MRAHPIAEQVGWEGSRYASVSVSTTGTLVYGRGLSRPAGRLTWMDRTGLSEPMPMPGPGWADYGPWTRRVKVDLDQLRAYAQAVAAETDSWLAGLSDGDLDRPMDLSGIGLGQHTWASAIALLLANHLGTETGEIAVLKGIQGARGYPM